MFIFMVKIIKLINTMIRNSNLNLKLIEKIIINKPKLNGDHQIENASIALAFAEIIYHKNIYLNFKKVGYAIKETSWPGRLEILNYKNNTIILDGSHNIDGAKKLVEFLKSKKFKPTVIFGMLNNKKNGGFSKNN